MPGIIIEKALELCKDFSAFSPAEKAEIAAICEFREYKAGQNVFSIEHQETYCYQHFPDWAGVGRLIEHNDAANA
ncbi:MAG TPA: hypothetical protein PK198_06740 [Saprospiraceae bacterium]|nr:hypothetical protein [Saprospiraceae bacterium]HRJ16759.1 hypothetical protein [Saprospiraceae bacterium]HRK83567.1 hypothetical protein [Saprospiraceae bacterium]